jgi:Fe-S-cluster-containing hydrogenase component 2
MKKDNIVVDPSKCRMCLQCQIFCSLLHEGEANPSKAQLVIGEGSINFLDTCREKCNFCADYCAYGALTVKKDSSGG